jgi:spore maturation protein SpmA
VLNWIFLALVLGAVLTGASTGRMPEVTRASLDGAKGAVDLVINLIGQMTLWLGFMGVLREAGLMRSLARGLKPLMVRLFPDVPPDHPAMGAMVLNIAANVLGIGNAATPFGLKAMAELDTLNPRRGVATDAMALFLAINTSGLAVLALGVVAVRASLGSKDPAGILVPSLLATCLSAVTAIVVAKLSARLPIFSLSRYSQVTPLPDLATAVKEIAGMATAEAAAETRPPAEGWRKALAITGTVLLLALVARALWFPAPGLTRVETGRRMLSDWLLPLLMAGICLFGLGRRVKVYETFIASAKEGFQIAVGIIPYLVAILVAVSMFRESGALKAVVSALGPVTARVGFPAEALPMALIRPLSGSGALAVMTETMRTYGPDSFVGYLVSVLNGSMETTFYVLAVYFGSVQVRVIRHTLVACLATDLVGILGSALVCHLFFG